MFKPTRKRVVKAKEKVAFKLEFHVTQVPQQRWDKLLVSIICLETGKVTSKTGKSVVRNGTCQWAEVLLELVSMPQDSNGKDAPKELYKLVVSMGLSRFGVLGDASINFSDYLQSTTPVSLSLPLQNCSSGSILHVKIQRILPKFAGRDLEDNKESVNQSSSSGVDQSAEGDALPSAIDDGSTYGEENSLKDDSIQSLESVDVPSTPLMEEARLFSREDDEFMSLTSSASSSGRHEAGSGVHDGESMSPETLFKPLGPSSSSYGSASLLSDNSPGRQSPEGSSSSLRVGHEDKKWETSQRRTHLQRTASVAMPSSWDHNVNQVAVAEIEALRQQLASEERRSKEVHKKLTILIAERDNIKQEMESLKLVEASKGGLKWQQQMEEDASSCIKELQDELDYLKGLNSNLSVQLEKTQESNSELLLEIQDLEKELEKHRSEGEVENTSVEDGDARKLVESLRKELVELERDSHELTEENLDLLSKLRRVSDELKEKDETIARLEAEKVQGNNAECVTKGQIGIIQGGEGEENVGCRCDIELQSLLDKLTKAEEDHQTAVDMIKKFEASYQMLEQEKRNSIETLKKQLEQTHEQLSAVSKLYNDELQTTKCREVERAELEVQLAVALREKEDQAISLCQLQAMYSLAEENLHQELLKGSKLTKQCEASEAKASQLKKELEESQIQLRNMQEIISELESSHTDLKIELQAILEKDKLNRSQIKDLEFCIATLEDETNSLRASRASLEAESQLMRSPKDTTNWTRQAKTCVEENLSQDTNVKGSRRPLEEKNTEANEQLQKQSNEKEIELQDLKTRVYYLEEELQRKASALASAERRLKDQRDSLPHDGENQVSYLSRSLSRANSRVGVNKPSIPLSREVKELCDLRSKVKLLEAEVKKKAADLEASKEQLKEQYTQLSSCIEHLELANQELIKEHSNSKLEQAMKEVNRLQNQNAMLCQRENDLLLKLASQEALQCQTETLEKVQEKEELQSSFSKFHAAAKGENILKRISTLETELADVLESNVMYKAQLQSVFAQQQNVHAAALENLGSVDKVIKDFAELKRKNSLLEDELCDMKERYFNMSLQFAEVEAEREQLVMTIRNMRGTKKFVPLRSAIF